MKIKLKFKALSVLMAGLQDTQMWVIYQMASGGNLSDSVTKADLIKIIAFLFKQLDWIEDTADSIETESALHHDMEVAADTPAEESDCTQPVTPKSTDKDHEEILSSEAGAGNLASNAIELNEKYNGEKKTQQLRLETGVEPINIRLEKNSQVLWERYERLEEDAPPIIHRLDKTDAEERAKFEKEARSSLSIIRKLEKNSV